MAHSDLYAKKRTTAEKAVSIIKSGDWVDYGWCLGHPVATDKALAARAKELSDVKVRGGISLWMPEICAVPNPKKHFTWNAWHCSGIDRRIIDMGCGYYGPMRYSELPRFYRESIGPIDVAMFQVAPMDEHGYFNFGPQASHMMAVCEQARVIIVEVNQNMPRCLGGIEEAIHISQVDFIVEGDNPPLAQLNSAPLTEVDKKVAELIVEEIPNGACLQLGIGGMPNAVGRLIAESDLKDLGVHTEMYVDAFVDMSLQGKINGSRKSIDRFRQVFAFAAGTRKMYDFLHNNPEIMSCPVDYCNDVRKVAVIDNFISINNAVEIDLFGQVSSESAGTRHISGTGGQLDFVMGAYVSNGGKSFICLSSTCIRDGEVKSRIVPTLASGSIVTDSRTCVQWVVTEFGKVNLKGKSTWERTEALISIAHPDFREELIRQAQHMKIWRNSHRI
ncbi:acyl-CoA--carboxylate coenzyme A transferase, putative [Syntrophotalea carbinolica DSM 2380]|uniref:Butyryl-CoA:acetate CoA-transferase n=1 Tax=Syntrophotalea carbinolica (strain DSM 2380 / NBRC 103641 / GraBd1) TaxID=338963 RepID=Q3A1S1_SYNC1|nr:butyryl-CoA:acetate CoA-transferase [Syntrophotalea carbinolica]ABA89686.1 acyl-CoA--carboxylate coenzyme A transferase, putative [Syntrophotalea carbinolica DSM 2380]